MGATWITGREGLGAIGAEGSGPGMLLDGGGAWAGGAILDAGDLAGIGGIAPVTTGGDRGGRDCEGAAC